jgi:ubiquinone biosynthesis protein UbiJ
MTAVYIILALMSPALLGIITHFILSWRKAPGSKEVAKLRQELDALRRDYAQIKADHTDMLLGLEASVHRLDARLDQLTGIDEAPATPQGRPTPQRQL